MVILLAIKQKMCPTDIQLHPNWFRQSTPQHTGGHLLWDRVEPLLIRTYLITNKVTLVSNEDFIPAQNRNADVGTEAQKELHHVDLLEAKDRGPRKQHGQATVYGEWALAWLPCPSYGYNQMTTSNGQQITP